MEKFCIYFSIISSALIGSFGIRFQLCFRPTSYYQVLEVQQLSQHLKLSSIWNFSWACTWLVFGSWTKELFFHRITRNYHQSHLKFTKLQKWISLIEFNWKKLISFTQAKCATALALLKIDNPISKKLNDLKFIRQISPQQTISIYQVKKK